MKMKTIGDFLAKALTEFLLFIGNVRHYGQGLWKYIDGLAGKRITASVMILVITLVAVTLGISAISLSSKYTAAKAEITTLENRLAFLEGIKAEVIEDAIVAARERECPIPRYVTVKPGDWLSKYAKRYYGDASRWREIWKLNPEITDPNLILPGQVIHIW